MFSSSWFATLAKGNFDTYITPKFSDKKCKYLEIGTFEGASLIYMVKHVLVDPESTAVVIDPFTFSKNQYEIFTSNINEYRDKIKVIKGFSQTELAALNTEQFDIIYIDGDHTSEAVLQDARLSFPLLTPGGYMIFDDYLWISTGAHSVENIHDPKLHHPCNPYTGINTFLEENKDSLEIVASNWQMIVKKKSA